MGEPPVDRDDRPAVARSGGNRHRFESLRPDKAGDVYEILVADEQRQGKCGKSGNRVSPALTMPSQFRLLRAGRHALLGRLALVFEQYLF